MINSKDKLILLRSSLKKNSIDAYIIPVSDPHLSENIPDHWQIVRWLTGFSGSAGVVVITDSFAGLWTDSRYYLQAEKQLSGTDFRVMKPDAGPAADHISWLSDKLKAGARVALDGRLFSVTSFRKLESKLRNKNVVIDHGCDIVSELWNDRPALPSSSASDHPVRFAGKDRSVKIREVREEMKKKEVDRHLLASCDDIMWLLNIRGNDFPYSPLLMSFLLVSENRIDLFAGKEKIPGDLVSEFEKLGIHIHPYDGLAGIISSLKAGSVILVSPAKVSISVWLSIPDHIRKVEGESIPAGMKSVKNKTEVENIGRVMVRDGVALTKFFCWFESRRLVQGLTERSVKHKLLELRKLQEGFLCPSFDTIAAYNEHGALPHYTETSESNSAIGPEGMLLIDSGGHYAGGTTDITRTISTGVPSLQQKKDFTLVLKGHINLASAKFPMGTRGYQLDILARKPLWENGLNYGHGTGHGVGYCLNVHEGPQGISPADNKTVIQPGMLISNEPAIYREGEYGIRTENLILCYEDEETEFGQFLKFDTVSLCYIDKSLIDKSLLDEKEIEWLNSYHAEVFDKISPYLTEPEKLWLRAKTEPL